MSKGISRSSGSSEPQRAAAVVEAEDENSAPALAARLAQAYGVSPAVAHKLIGVARRPWMRYRSGERALPEYILYSILAHIELAQLPGVVDRIRAERSEPPAGRRR